MNLGTPLNGRGVRLLRLPSVLTRCGRSRSSIFRDIEAGLFPPAISIGLRCAAWPEHEVDAVLSARVAGLSADELRKLVVRLVAARSKLKPDDLNAPPEAA